MRKHFIFIPIILLALFSVGFLLWAQDGQDSAGYPDASEYAPNFWFDSEEKYYPADPLDFYYDENGNEFSGKIAVAEYDKLSLDEKMEKVKIFYKVDDTGSEFVYQYWIFYVMNNYENGHYGDWESVFIFVDKESGNINKAVGSGHGAGHKLEIKSESMRHIWVYVGNGSHANCPVEVKGDTCGFRSWKYREEWDSGGKVFSSVGMGLVVLDYEYIKNFGDGGSFTPSKSPTLGFNLRKMLRLESTPFNIPFFDEKKESYINIPLIGDYFGKTPTFAWVKDEYHNPQEILTPTHTKIARKASGFFNNAGSFLAAIGNVITSPITNLFTANIFENRSNSTGSDPAELVQVDLEVGGADIPTPQDGVGGDPTDTPVPLISLIVAQDLIPSDTPIDVGGSTPHIDDEPEEPEIEVVFVTRIIDGDTVELASGQKLRYIGINTPETPNGCFANEATEKNSELVLNKQIILLNGPTDTDKFGRLLRFVWQDTDLSGTLSDSDVFVNLVLVEGGYAYAFDFGEAHAYGHRFETSEATARRERLGLWGDVCHPSVEFLAKPKPIIRMYEPPNSIATSNNNDPEELSEGDNGEDNNNDETPPDALVISIADNTFFNSSSDTNSEEDGYQIILSGTAEASSLITIIQNPTYTATTTEEGNWASEVTLTNEGANIFSITAKDAAGNTSTSTLVTLNLDSIAPTSTIAVSDYKIDETEFKISWSADADDLDYYEVEYKIDNIGAWQDWGSATTTETDKDYKDATSNIYHFRVRGVDIHQNIGEWQESAGVVIDLTSPIVINEIQINNAEFVELYNAGSKQISLKDYYFSYYSSTRITWSGTSTPYGPRINKQFPNNAEIPAKGYFLIGIKDYPESGGNPNADWQVLKKDGTPYATGQLSNSKGTIAIFPFNPKLFDESATSSQYVYDNRIDAVGWDNDFDGDSNDISLYEPYEQSSPATTTPATTTPSAGESLTRDADHIDTDKNSADFAIATSTPRNSKDETYTPPQDTTPLWAMYQKDARHSGLTTLSGPTWTDSSQATTTWIFEMKKGQGFEGARSQPVIGGDGVVYVTSALGNIYAINPNGSQKWKFDPRDQGGVGNGSANASPALSPDGQLLYSVYTDTVKGKLRLFAIKTSDGTTGMPGWKYSINGANDSFTSPVLDSNGNIYVASKSRLYSISSSGKLNSGWPFAPYNEHINHALGINMPAISEEGGVEYIYINASISNTIGDKYIFKLDTNGNEAIEKGQLSDPKSLGNGTSISSAGTLYTGGYVSYNTSGLYALDPSDLSEIWYAPLGANVAGPIPSFDTEGNIYIGTSGLLSSGVFYKLNATGTILWTFTEANPGENKYPAVVDSQGRVYIGAKDNYIYVLNPSDGTVIWKYLLFSSEPKFYPVGFAIGDGRVYAVGYDGKIYAF